MIKCEVYDQFCRRDDATDKLTECYNTDIERDIAIGDAKADGYIMVREWDEVENGDEQ